MNFTQFMKENPAFQKSGSIFNKIYGLNTTLTEANKITPKIIEILIDKNFAFELQQISGSYELASAFDSVLFKIRQVSNGRALSQAQRGADLKSGFVRFSDVLTPSQYDTDGDTLTPSLQAPLFFEGFETIQIELLTPENYAGAGFDVSMIFKGVAVFTGVNQ